MSSEEKSAKELEVEILYIAHVPSAKAGRIGKRDVQIVYRLPEGFVRTVTVPEEEFTEENVKKYIAEDLKELAAWRGRRLKISL